MPLLCDQCDYDLRAQADDGVCPECGMSVVASREAAQVPRRPAWRDSDRAWRRRMLLGLWVLVLLPLPTLLDLTGWSERIPLPSLFGNFDPDRTLASDSLFGFLDPCLTFFIGTVLLFGRERFRRPNRRDFLKRWGIFGSCIVTFIGVASLAFIGALVGLGIAALIHSMPPENQPALLPWILNLSHGYMLYGPQPDEGAYRLSAVSAALVILLACSPIYDALRAVGLKKLAWIIPTPLAGLALAQIVVLAVNWYFPGYDPDVLVGEYFFVPDALDQAGFDWMGQNYIQHSTGDLVLEGLKWGSVLLVALILTGAQAAAWRARNRRPHVGDVRDLR